MARESTKQASLDPRTVSSERVHLLTLKQIVPYQYVRDRYAGKTLLDLGCGSGYGSSILAETAEKVVGVDLNPDNLDVARAEYDRPNVEYKLLDDPYETGLPQASFDAAVSIHVIEHVYDVERYLRMLHDLVKPGGEVILATPNRRVRLMPFQPPWNVDHVREYNRRQLERDLHTVFEDVTLYGVYGTDDFDTRVKAYYGRSAWRGYVYLPLRNLSRRVLPKSAYSTVQKTMKPQRSTNKDGPSDSSFTTDDVQIGQDLDRALDFFAVCRRPS